jgi:hypothetical protein
LMTMLLKKRAGFAVQHVSGMQLPLNLVNE